MKKRCRFTDRDRQNLARIKRLVAILSVSLAASISTYLEADFTILKETVKHMSPSRNVDETLPPLMPVNSVEWLRFTERV